MDVISRSDKQTQAVICNFKEQRCLEKSLQTLSLEQAYSISLINLDHKVLKVQYKRLKDKVSRIKSHLSMDHIKEMQGLEESGQIRESALRLDSSTRISAAAKRLKLQTGSRSKSAVPRLAVSTDTKSTFNLASDNAVPRCNSVFGGKSATMEPASPRRNTSSSKLTANSALATSNSLDVVDGKYLNTSSNSPGDRRKSVDFRIPNKAWDKQHEAKQSSDIPATTVTAAGSRQHLMTQTSVKEQVPESPRHTQSRASVKSTVSETTRYTQSRTPSTMTSSDRPRRSMSSADQRPGKRPPPTIPATNKFYNKIRPVSVGAPDTGVEPVETITRPATTSLLTSTQATKKLTAENKEEMQKFAKRLADGFSKAPFTCHTVVVEEKKEKPYRPTRENALTGTDNEIDTKLGTDVHEEMKKGMKLNEVVNSLHIEDKIDTFMERLDGYLKENPCHFGHEEDIELTIAKEKVKVEVSSAGEKTEKRPKRNKLRRRQLVEALGGTDKKERTEEVWKDVNKCRYLRVPDEMIDLSGIVTLAKDQMKLFEGMKFDYE